MPEKKEMPEKVSPGKNVTPQNVMPEKKVTPQTSSPEKSDDEHQVENGIVGSKRHPTVLVCNNENCTLKRSLMGSGYEVAMRIKKWHISGLKKDAKKELFPADTTPKKKSPKSNESGSPRRSPRLREQKQIIQNFDILPQIDWKKILYQVHKK